MTPADITTIALTAEQIRTWSDSDSAAMRARGPALVRLRDAGVPEPLALEAVRANLEAYLHAHPDTGAVRLHIATVAREPIDNSQHEQCGCQLPPA